LQPADPMLFLARRAWIARAVHVGANEIRNFLHGRAGLWNERRQELPCVWEILVDREPARAARSNDPLVRATPLLERQLR
jgi:hypothetical protein